MPRTRRLVLVACLLAALPFTVAVPANALVREVLITHAGTDDVVADLVSGERLWLDLRQDCFALRGRVGYTVLLWSPTPVINAQSRLLVPEQDATCPVWQVDTLAQEKPAKAPPVLPLEGLRAMRRSLELLGYDCGPPAQEGWTPEAGQAFLRFREGKRLEISPQGLRRAVTALALDVMRGRQATGTSQRLARVISDQLDPLVSYLSSPGSAGARCGPPTWIREVARDGALVTLGDGTDWQPVAEQRAMVSRWQDFDDLVVCSSRLVNARTGEMARATRLE